MCFLIHLVLLTNLIQKVVFVTLTISIKLLAALVEVLSANVLTEGLPNDGGLFLRDSYFEILYTLSFAFF
ncbi:hypothetical protein VCHA51O444_10365 [Vibrio chagasii]|nr:hypothetical protein VCHA51O444_10365 [Vibrio chagasii]CAH7334892.1 hypothetical protein VCHA53O474_30176 [Vibrio chagasii]